MALLVLARGEPVHRAALAQTLWPFPDYSADNAAFYLRRTLHALKRTLQEQAYRLKTPTSQTLALDITGAEVDTILFEDLAQSGDPEQQGRAVAFYRGPLLAACTELWVLPHRERLEALRLSLQRPTAGLPAAPRSPGNSSAHDPGFLPHPITELIGRDGLLTRLKAELKRTRLLMLTGPGGVGKTRLAIALADAVQPLFKDGARFVDLTLVTDASVLLDVVADALRVRARAGQDLLSALEEFLAPRNLLLVLDNCERLRVDCAELTVRLLRLCGGLKIVATSRESLGVMGEMVRNVPGLGAVEPETLSSDSVRAVRQVAASGAAQLFLRAAQSVSEDFHITAAHAYDVARLCRLLDGLPLALELAAARIGEQPLSELIGCLQSDLGALASDTIGMADRHRSLDTCLRWSWDRLSPIEQCLLRRLTVFAGGWTLTAAEAICGEGADVPSGLASLARKSLIVPDNGDAETRYRLLETVRQFARTHLSPNESATLHHRHMVHYLEMAESADLALYTEEHSRTLHLLDREIGNLRAALAWSLQGHGDAEAPPTALGVEWTDSQPMNIAPNTVPDRGNREAVGLRLANALAWYYKQRGRMAEGHRWLLAALETPEVRRNSSLRAEGLHTLGVLALAQGDLAQSSVCLEQAVTLYQQHESRSKQGYALYSLGEVAMEQEDYKAAYRWCMQAIDVFPDARALFHILLSQVLRAAGDIDQARRLIMASLKFYRTEGVTSRVVECLLRMSDIERTAHDRGAAQLCIREALALTWATANLFWLAHLVCRQAALEIKPGDLAGQLLGAADGLMDRMGAVWTPSERRMQQPLRAACVAARGEAAFERSLSAGRSLSWQEVADLALSRSNR